MTSQCWNDIIANSVLLDALHYKKAKTFGIIKLSFQILQCLLTEHCEIISEQTNNFLNISINNEKMQVTVTLMMVEGKACSFMAILLLLYNKLVPRLQVVCSIYTIYRVQITYICEYISIVVTITHPVQVNSIVKFIFKVYRLK